MRLKLLLLLLFASCMLYAQEPYRNLIFSEVRMDQSWFSYCEFTNMGDKTINLSEFEFGCIGPWTAPWTTAGSPSADYRMRLPNKMLDPGKSFLLSVYWNLPDALSPIDPEKWIPRKITPDDMKVKADLLVSEDEQYQYGTGYAAYDIITPGWRIMDIWWGRDCWYLRHHYTPNDSIVVDAVNASFNNTTSPYKSVNGSDVAGEPAGTDADPGHGTGGMILVRKYSVKQGVGDAIDSWTKVKGVDITDSEWLPIPLLSDSRGYPERMVYWTVGNHGLYLLNSTTLQSTTVKQNWAAATLTVDYGVRKLDGLMKQFTYKPGLAWFYKNALTHADSAFNSVRTGDTLIVYAVGNTLIKNKFALIAATPGPDAKVVVPKNGFNPSSNSWGGAPFIVTENKPGMDTITASPIGIPYATRIDTLYKYLEKPSNASWKIIFVDGKVRVDLKLGDKLVVTAQNGTTKEYYLKVGKYLPSHNAYLSAITWPEIPDWFIDLYGWKGDTIPSFGRAIYNYTIDIPAETEGFPAFVALTEDLNTKVEVKRAVSLSGSTENRTITFNTAAEDDTTLHSYTVLLNKLKADKDKQPWKGEPFISQFVSRTNWSELFIEICNPGTELLDLSNYMIVRSTTGTPAEIIRSGLLPADWNNRFLKYVPGFIWQNQASWEVQPGILKQDLNVNPLVYPGDVFVLGSLGKNYTGNNLKLQGGINMKDQVDVWFRQNMWGETFDGWNNVGEFWFNNSFWLFKIVNDSITRGLKPVGDPNDFEVIDVWGPGDGSNWIIGGVQADQTEGYIRKPQYYKGNTILKGSFGTNMDNSEWLKTNRASWDALGIPWPYDVRIQAAGLGSHFMNEVTVYKSTVGSIAYKVSEGYSMKETIRGVKTGTTVSGFLANIIKANAAQGLKLKKAGTGGIIVGDELVGLNDTLVVVSADSTNTSKYILNVTTEGLSKDAKLTSTKYTITINGATGEVKNFDYGTTLKTILANVTKPANSILTLINKDDAYVALTTLNKDTVVVDTKVSDQIYLEVTAEDGVTKIVYQLKPNATASDAFVTSELYQVDQVSGLISLLPRGTTVSSFLKNVYPVTGASLKMVDKAGFERTSGDVSLDDKLIVTSKDGKTVKVYFLSMLQETYLATKYAAYVTSSVYKVDQVGMVLSGPTGKTLLTDFYSKITPAFGAKAVVINSKGEENKTADLNGGDMLKVTAADGVTIAWYTLQLDLTTAQILGDGILTVYPNPTTGHVNISGLENGNRIRIYNLLGAQVLDKVAVKTLEVVSIDSQPAGLYFITISNADRTVGKFKVVKQ